MPHIQVADVAASAAAAVELGGAEVMHGKDGDGRSQWAVLLDPNGAAFGIIPLVTASDAAARDGRDSAGLITWLDLTVEAAAATCDFYVRVVGWSVDRVGVDSADERFADYTMLGGDGRPAAGIRHARGANAGLPPVWLISLPVGDLAESLRRVRDGGGSVIQEERCDGQWARAVIADPVGVHFALVAG